MTGKSVARARIAFLGSMSKATALRIKIASVLLVQIALPRILRTRAITILEACDALSNVMKHLLKLSTALRSIKGLASVLQDRRCQLVELDVVPARRARQRVVW